MSNQNGGMYAHLHIMCNNPAKFHKNLSSVFRGVAFTKLFGRPNADHYCHSVASRQGDKKGIRVEYISLLKPEIKEFKRMGGRH
jgi:hypothetical protein